MLVLKLEPATLLLFRYLLIFTIYKRVIKLFLCSFGLDYRAAFQNFCKEASITVSGTSIVAYRNLPQSLSVTSSVYHNNSRYFYHTLYMSDIYGAILFNLWK